MLLCVTCCSLPAPSAAVWRERGKKNKPISKVESPVASVFLTPRHCCTGQAAELCVAAPEQLEDEVGAEGRDPRVLSLSAQHVGLAISWLLCAGRMQLEEEQKAHLEHALAWLRRELVRAFPVL